MKAEIAVEIDAPIEAVWRVMLDTARYGEWNPFIVRVDRAEGAPFVGQRMRLHVVAAKGGLVPSDEEILVLDAPSSGRATFTYAFRGFLHTFGLVRATRVQTLEERGGVTVYRSVETFRGLLVAQVPIAHIQAGFARQAEALKARAEAFAARAG